MHSREFTFINMADELTDQELRRQLVELGSKTVGPITATTRSIYVKKLNHLKVAAKKAHAAAARARPGRKLFGFSSDDESDGESAPPEPVGRRFVSRRKGSAAVRKTETNADTGNSHASLTRPSLRRTRNDAGSNNHRGAGSLSMQASFNSIGGESSLARPADGGSTRPLAQGRPSAARPDPNAFDSSDSEEDRDFDDLNGLDDTDLGFSSPERVSRSINTSARLDDSSLFNRTFSKIPDVIGTMWLSGPSPARSTRSRSTVNHNDRTLDSLRSNDGTPLSAITPPISLFSNKTYPRERSANDILANARHRPPPMLNNSTSNHISQNDKLADEETILKQGFKTKEDPSAYRMSQKIPLVLEGLFVIFFAALALALVYMSIPSGSTDDADSQFKDDWMICPNGIAIGECYTRENVEKARDVVLDVVEMLALRAGDYDCSWHNRRNMTEDEVRTRIRNKYGQAVFGATDAGNSYKTAIHLIHKNPHWKISMYNGRGDPAVSYVDMRWMESQSPYYRFFCHAQYVAVVACYVVGIISVVAALVTLCWWRAKRREEETQAVYRLEEQIIDILKAHHDKCQTTDDLQPFLAIPHVRDMIIPPKDRRRLQSRWDMAVKFLSANESRIRVETQKISGEEFAVWRWLQTSANGKVWQGPAFGENRDNVKHFKFQCLKIRNMFDPDIECDQDWHVNIEDAILEKVSPGEGENSGIVHVAVDKTSREGCVYVKCSSPQEAGKAYRALHGWWFDNNLVTVKYLRTERYYERYPEAAHADQPLTPSNNHRRSLSQPFHHSIYESC